MTIVSYYEAALQILELTIIVAIQRCIDIILERNYQGSDTMIHSDSQADVKALNSYVIDSKLIWECPIKLNEVGKNNKVSLVRIPGHSGIKGNEEDRKEAQAPLTGPKTFCSMGKCTSMKEFMGKEETERQALMRNLLEMNSSDRFF